MRQLEFAIPRARGPRTVESPYCRHDRQIRTGGWPVFAQVPRWNALEAGQAASVAND